MKTVSKLLLILMFPLFSFGNDYEEGAYTKEKSVSKSFNVTSDAMLQTSNSYGNINVYLWDENKISIQVSIKVSGNNEDKVNEKLNSIDIAFDASDSKVSAATILGNSNWKNGNNLNYEINYTIKIPRNGNISLANKYGNIGIEKLNGTSSISCQYGNISLGSFTNKSNNISLSYSGDSSITSIDKLNINSQYSQVEIQNINQLNIDGNYNGFVLQNVGTLMMSSNYTKISSKTIQKFNCNGNYLTLKLGDIGQSLDLNSNYSDINFNTTFKTKNIVVNGNYSNTKITCTSEVAFDFDINLKYGGFKDEIGLKYSEKSEKNNSKNYRGYNISTGKSSISVTTNYGSVQLINK